MGVAAAVATLVVVGSTAAAPDRIGPVRSYAPGSGSVLVVGYSTPAGLATALRGAAVVRLLPALHAVEVRTRVAGETLRRAQGIRFVSRPAARGAAAEPAVALALASPAAGWEWQFRGTHEDAVPDAVLRAAVAITIAVIDTGADLTAPDLAAKSPTAYNTRTGTGDVRDDNGHGTFVASVAAGSVTNGDGIAGAGGDAQLLVVKAGTADGTFTDVDEAAGILYAVDHGARIINISFGGPGTSSIERHAIQYAFDHGVLVVAAVGNEYAHGEPDGVSGGAAAAARIERCRRCGSRGRRVDVDRRRVHASRTRGRGSRSRRPARTCSATSRRPRRRRSTRAPRCRARRPGCTATRAARRSRRRRSPALRRSSGRRTRS